MNAPRWQQVEDLFHAARERPAESRAAYLAEACSGDADLLREVESLLAQDATGPLDRPAWQGADSLLRDETLPAGTPLGPYEITGILGQGGMGRVYSARDSRLGRSVAIKIATGNFGERFRQETRAVAALNHPNICTLHDVGPNYLVMELVEGNTLADRIRQGPLPLEEALAIARQIADALEAAHAQGIVHRDLKPANIKVKPNGTVKVIDFGLAKNSLTTTNGEQTVTITQPGMILGTASYMAPEQASGKALDRRVDIWAFGVVLAEMLTGKRLFQGDTLAETMAAVIKDPPKLDRLPKATPPAVRQLLARCLEKDPAQRLRDIGEARIALAAPAPPAQRRIWIAVAATAAMATAGLVALRPRTETVTGAAPIPVIRPILTSPAAETQPALSPDGQTVAYASTGEDGKNVDLYTKPIDGETPLRITNTPEAESWPQWSPDGKYLAFARRQTGKVQLLLVPVKGGVERTVAELASRGQHDLVPRVAWHPGGKHLVYSTWGDRAEGPAFLQSLDLETGARRTLTQPPPGAFGDRYPAYFPDGRRVAFWRATTLSSGTVEVLNLKDGVSRSYPVPQEVVTIQVDPAGQELILSFWPYLGVDRLRRLKLDDGTLRVMPQMPANVLYPSLSADGRRMVVQQLTRDTNIWRVPLLFPGKAGPPASWIASTYEDYDPRYSPDGSQILFSSNRTGKSRPWLVDRQGQHPRILDLTGPYAGSPRWSPDGRRIAFDVQVKGSSQVSVVSSLGGAAQQITNDPFENGVPSWSHDSQWIYYCSNRTGRQEIWRIRPNGGASEQVTHEGGFESQASRDGQYLYFSRSRANPSVVRRSRDGVEETLVSDLSGRAWVAGDQGIYYINQARTQLMYFDFAQRKSAKVLALEKTVRTIHRLLDLSPDGRELSWPQVDSSSSDIVLVEDLRE